MVELLLQHEQRFRNVSQISLLLALSRALQEASLVGYEQIVKILIQQGADLNAQGGAYDTALQAAASSGHGGIVRLLLDAGANINAKGGRYGTALLAATIEQQYGKTALHYATETRRSDIVRVFIQANADRTIHDSEGRTALHYAQFSGLDVGSKSRLEVLAYLQQ